MELNDERKGCGELEEWIGVGKMCRFMVRRWFGKTSERGCKNTTVNFV